MRQHDIFLQRLHAGHEERGRARTPAGTRSLWSGAAAGTRDGGLRPAAEASAAPLPRAAGARDALPTVSALRPVRVLPADGTERVPAGQSVADGAYGSEVGRVRSEWASAPDVRGVHLV